MLKKPHLCNTSPVSCVRKQKEDKTAREPARYLGETAGNAQERGQDHLEGGESHQDEGAGQAQFSIRAPGDGGCPHRDEGVWLANRGGGQWMFSTTSYFISILPSPYKTLFKK